MLEFARMTRLPPYVFATVDKLKMDLRHKGEDIIDLGMGNPDIPTPKHIVDRSEERRVGKECRSRWSPYH